MIELYVTPFDDWKGWHNPGEIETSDLGAGQVVGFAITVYDHDYASTASKSSDPWTWWTPEGMSDGFSSTFAYADIWRLRANVFLDGILLPTRTAEPENTAVKSVSWGRIKASLDD